jgi:hypothetical protein
MRGGTSTSNSALLTDAAKAQQTEAAVAPAAPVAAPDRTRVRDLIAPEDVEVIEVYPGPKEVVPFPDAHDSVAVEHEAQDPVPAADTEPAEPVGGSVVNVPADKTEPRTPVGSFDQLGNAIQQELARDGSVPPVEAKKGPDLASRFGPVEERAAKGPVSVPEVEEPNDSSTEEEVLEDADDEPTVEHDDTLYEPAGRSNAGLIAAIWALTAIASGAVATLHFTGII